MTAGRNTVIAKAAKASVRVCKGGAVESPAPPMDVVRLAEVIKEDVKGVAKR